MWWTLLKILTGLTFYGTAIEPRIVVRNDEIASVPNLPDGWQGKQFAVFADLQVGMWWANTDAARRVVRRVVHARPAFVLIPGDFVYDADSGVAELMETVVAILRPILDDSIPILAVLGNHDYSLMHERSDPEDSVARRVVFELEKAGVHMIDNKVRAMQSPARAGAPRETLYVAGIGEKWSKNDSVAAVMSQLPEGAPRVVLVHDPDSFARIPAGQAPIAVAGHTHGMQLGIPFLTDYIWRHHFSDEGSGAAGWQDGFGNAGNRLYINRGIGFSAVPARLHAFPELTVFTLERAP